MSLPLLTAQTELPNGPGKDTVKRICGNCHEIETVTSSRRTKIGWQQMVDEMITRGAEGTEDEMSEVVAYLTTSFGKVNVNAAPAGELQKTLGLTDKEAQAIVSYREQKGKYKNFDEFVRTPGIGAEKLGDKRSLVAFSQ